MRTTVGDGDYRFRPIGDWEQLPEGWSLGDVAAVAVDRWDRVYVFHRGPHPLIVLSAEGEYLHSWGDDVFVRPHGLFVAPDDTIYCTDEGGHCVRQYTLDGKPLHVFGAPGRPVPYQSGQPFNRCTHTALSPDGDVYVTDGYGNSRVHKYSPDGRLIQSWGEPGSLPGQFNLPHNICCDADGYVYVADRENHRIQIFDGSGRFEGQWNNLHRPSALHLTNGQDPVFFVGEIGPYLRSNFGWPNLGPRLSVLSKTGDLLSRVESDIHDGVSAGSFVSPHSIAVDSRGDLYVGDVCLTGWPSLFPDQPIPRELSGLHKFAREQTHLASVNPSNLEGEAV